MTPPTKKRMVWSVSISLGAVMLLGVVGPLIAYKTRDISVCPISGSTKTRITWFGHFSHDERTVSALERWIERREPAFEPQWRKISTTTYYVLGRGYACGRAPEIYHLRPILDAVVSKCSDESISGLVAVLRQGTQDEQRQVIQRIADAYLDTK
jgi:hypothetical protein